MGENRSENDAINAYATLLTRPTYLAGAILLSYTLHKHSPSTPLVILYTPLTLPESCVKALENEAKHSNAIPYPIEHLHLPASRMNGTKDTVGMVAERFADTWTKLRVFEILSTPSPNARRISNLCFLDADMLVFSNPSPLIFNSEVSSYLSAGDGRRLCATHVCVCNLDGDPWAPSTWRKENCAFSHLNEPAEVAKVKAEPETMSIFNSGAFVFRPSQHMTDFVMGSFTDADVGQLRVMKFPDQDFLNLIFCSRWSSLSWRTNALKTWRYWHPNIWRDDTVSVLHYIVDKPWAALVKHSADGASIAGYKGQDGVTHEWWWAEYERWREMRQKQAETELLSTFGKFMASPGGEKSEEMRAIGGRAQNFAKKWEDGEGTDGKAPKEQRQNEGGGPVLRKKMLGERGHGPVVRGGFCSGRAGGRVEG